MVNPRLLVLLWRFSTTLMSVPAEALASAHRVLIHSWLSSRFPHQALQGTEPAEQEAVDVVEVDRSGDRQPSLI